MKLPLCRPAVLLTTAVATLAVSLPSTALAHPQHSKAKEYSLDQYAVPADLTTGPDGALYAPDGSLDRLWRVTTKGKVSHIPVPGGPAGVATGKDGALWVTARTDDQIHRVTTRGKITSYQLPEDPTGTRAFPTDIVVGPRRRALVHRGARRPDRSHHHQGRGHRVPDPDRRRRSPPTSRSARTARSGSPSRAATRSAASPPRASVTEYPLATPDSLPSAIVTGRDGALYFAGGQHQRDHPHEHQGRGDAAARRSRSRTPSRSASRRPATASTSRSTRRLDRLHELRRRLQPPAAHEERARRDHDRLGRRPLVRLGQRGEDRSHRDRLLTPPGVCRTSVVGRGQ